MSLSVRKILADYFVFIFLFVSALDKHMCVRACVCVFLFKWVKLLPLLSMVLPGLKFWIYVRKRITSVRTF